MTQKTSYFITPIIPFAVPALLAFALVFIIQQINFQTISPLFSISVTADFVLTIPLVYFLLIRKKSIPTITVVPVFVLCTFIARWILPTSQQFYLTQIHNWVIPVVELGVFGTIIHKIYTLRKNLRKEKNSTLDFYNALQIASREVLPDGVRAFFVTEISAFYYFFASLKAKKQTENTFSYHKNSGTFALLWTVVFLILVESSAVHLLVHSWSVMVAWVLTGLSLYSVFQVIGMARSMTKRQTQITKTHLELRYGIMGEVNIPLENIAKVEITTKDIEFEGLTQQLSPLGELDSYNVLIHVKNEETLYGLWGKTQKFNILAIHIDDKNRFVQQFNA